MKLEPPDQMAFLELSSENSYDNSQDCFSPSREVDEEDHFEWDCPCGGCDDERIARAPFLSDPFSPEPPPSLPTRVLIPRKAKTEARNRISKQGFSGKKSKLSLPLILTGLNV